VRGEELRVEEGTQTGGEIAILLPNNQRQHRTLHTQKETAGYREGPVEAEFRGEDHAMRELLQPPASHAE
jgi:hypothetical protein